MVFADKIMKNPPKCQTIDEKMQKYDFLLFFLMFFRIFAGTNL